MVILGANTVQPLVNMEKQLFNKVTSLLCTPCAGNGTSVFVTQEGPGDYCEARHSMACMLRDHTQVIQANQTRQFDAEDPATHINFQEIIRNKSENLSTRNCDAPTGEGSQLEVPPVTAPHNWPCLLHCLQRGGGLAQTGSSEAAYKLDFLPVCPSVSTLPSRNITQCIHPFLSFQL